MQKIRQWKLTLPQRSSPASGPGFPHNQPLSWKNILIPSHCNRYSRIADDNHDQMASDHPPGQRWGFWVAWCPLAPLQKAHRKWKMDVTTFTIWWFIPFMKWPARGRYPSSKGNIIIINDCFMNIYILILYNLYHITTTYGCNGKPDKTLVAPICMSKIPTDPAPSRPRVTEKTCLWKDSFHLDSCVFHNGVIPWMVHKIEFCCWPTGTKHVI